MQIAESLLAHTLFRMKRGRLPLYMGLAKARTTNVAAHLCGSGFSQSTFAVLSRNRRGSSWNSQPIRLRFHESFPYYFDQPSLPQVVRVMSNRRNRLIALVLLALVAISWWFLGRGPTYGGRSFDHWLRQEHRLAGGPITFPTDPSLFTPEAEHAIRMIDTNALPTLIGMLEHQESTVHEWLRTRLEKQSLVKWRLETPRQLRKRAMGGLLLLKTRAVPPLIDLLGKPNLRPYVLGVLQQVNVRRGLALCLSRRGRARTGPD